jgi:hypothetical protein
MVEIFLPYSHAARCESQSLSYFQHAIEIRFNSFNEFDGSSRSRFEQ